ncbi:hypothetical protein A7U60_g5057 [Sanghuangporus baumii]|uniref:Uncharacterized protein n=1 Tax=Sanghuangporus baumii TaxID=108892 RepID=A0A9Q5HXZ8_SANBA|nr:hypothetical protein A7U60_g5057 [Sanghuangporus baumii]
MLNLSGTDDPLAVIMLNDFGKEESPVTRTDALVDSDNKVETSVFWSRPTSVSSPEDSDIQTLASHFSLISAHANGSVPARRSIHGPPSIHSNETSKRKNNTSMKRYRLSHQSSHPMQ